MPTPPTPSSGSPLLTRTEAAKRLNVSPRTVDNLAAAGQLPRVKIRRACRFRIEDVLQFIADSIDNGSARGAG